MPTFGPVLASAVAHPTQANLAALISASQDPHFGDEDIAQLAIGLASSGVRLPRWTIPAADVASTGGPSSLSTLLCPLFLRSSGYVVPKLGVPGRPAGGVDVLSGLQGYRVALTVSEVQTCIDIAGYAHFLPTEFAPLDASLFALRQQIGAQDVPPLVIASLLSKKIAVGLHRAGIEIRIGPHANFGTTWETARKNAFRLCRVAKILKLEVACFLTDGSRPYQPWIGRGESLQALGILFAGQATPALSNHAAMCWRVALRTIGENDHAPPLMSDVKSHFVANLVAQGSSWAAFENKLALLAKQQRFVLRATRAGFFNVNLGLLRTALVDAQRRATIHEMEFQDPCGVQLLVAHGEHVDSGTEVALVRVEEPSANLVASIGNAFSYVADSSLDTSNHEVEEISATSESV